MKNNGWKIVLIFALIVIAVYSLVIRDPESDKWKLNLKPGLDIGGGTSLIYEIDATEMAAKDRKGLAQSMIPILQRRIDPDNVANIVIRPQGDTRIEIQLPLSSPETKKRREAYEQALEALQKENLNLLTVKRSLSLEPNKRAERLAQFSGNSEKRKSILDQVTSAYDALKVVEQKRDRYITQREQLKTQIETTNILKGDFVESMAVSWSKKTGQDLMDTIKKQVDDVTKGKDVTEQIKTKAIELITQYMDAYRGWADAVNELTREGGVRQEWQTAAEELQKINLDIDALTSALDMPETADRAKIMVDFKERFPDRTEKIDAVIDTFKKYSAVRGALDDPEDLKRMLRGAGVLEFRILPTIPDPTGKTNTSELEGYVEALQTKGPKGASDDRYVWMQIEDPKNWKVDRAILAPFGDKVYVLASNQNQTNETMLRNSGEQEWKLKRARPFINPETGWPAILFSLDPIAANLFYNVTKNNIGRPLCILLDNQAISAPNIESAISSSGTITGQFTETEVQDLVNKLNAGSFRASLSEVPISEKTIGSTLGEKNRNEGITAGLFGLVAVAVFMLIYYLRSGLIADVALLLNLLFILAIMSIWQATFTLPGIAGLILTIGMSVDANVLIFERIREEQERGSPIRTAIANGYSRAFRTILDANITTFFVALILYMVASEEIKGFAIVLMLGIVSSMFTALFVTRMTYSIQLDTGLLTDHLSMLRLIHDARINWMGLRKVFITVSGVLIIGGLSAFFLRDETTNSKYDIEFTGGTSVQIDLKASTPWDNRDKVEQRFQQVAREQFQNDALAAANVYSIGKTGSQYEITTTETNKTLCTVKFDQVGKSIEDVTNAIRQAAEDAAGTLYNLKVTVDTEGKTFTVSTSQVNKGLVKSVLEKAFTQNGTVGEPTVDEVVSEAVRTAFEGYLSVREDLGIEIASTEKVADTDVELTDYLGGIKITAKLREPTTATDLKQRFRDVRFKPDMQDLTWYRYNILSTDLAELAPEEEVGEFVYVSVHPEAGSRELDEEEWNRFVTNEQTKIIQTGSLSTTLSRVTQIDPSIGQEAKTRALIAIILSLIAIVAYIWIRFGTARYGIAAIAALVHDVCITLGAVVVCTYLAGTPIGKMLLIQDFKINLQIIAAFLTIIGYSLNDTIVVFDRIRENRGKLSTLTPQIITDSINQTLSRTILTSFTTFLVVLIMYLWGGTGLRGFTFAMLFGIIIGTYSSIAIAAPILLIGSKKDTSLKK
ncbi:MAG: protein translocase subunit SecD [Sedimentisphaerales bacterium]|nr:protein translocase subunit SecD [Sedimentisphaerales bacterium]